MGSITAPHGISERPSRAREVPASDAPARVRATAQRARGVWRGAGYSPAVTWLLAILALSVLIIIHEFGHYACARIGGMHVDRFSVLGIGPVILRLGTYKGTEFVISAIPFGAYVHIVGMEPEEYAQDEQGELPQPPPGTRNFRDSPVWARLLAIAGGPLFNYIAAILIVVGVFTSVGVQQPVATQVASMTIDSPALAAGVQVGDEIVSIDGEDMLGDGGPKVIEATKAKLGQTIALEVRRGEELLVCDVTLNPEPPALNAQLAPRVEWAAINPAEGVLLGIKWPFEQTQRQLSGLWSLITGKIEARVGGPVAIAKAIKVSADTGWVQFIMFSALISTLLGMFNLLPLPALDGGRLVFLFYELITRRPPNKLLEERVHTAGMIALLALIAWATFHDVKGEPPPKVWASVKAQFDVEAAQLDASGCRPVAASSEATPANTQ
jgi:regulator of sigma E protease